VAAWENDLDDRRGCIVFGTLNPDGLARDRARDTCACWYGDPDDYDVTEPVVGWWRDGYNLYGRAWIDDPARGRPGVMFTWTELP
jgi:hypothetical protein